MKSRRAKQVIFVILGLMALGVVSAHAIDSGVTRQTLVGLKGVNVVVEELQPDIQRYTQKFLLQKEQIKADVESMLRKSGITVLTYEQWLAAPGRPFLYVAVNTHEYEKYWYAYDIKVQLRQRVFLEMNPSITTIASTWAINMTGSTNIAKLNEIKDGLGVLVRRFAEAWNTANAVKSGN